MTRIAFVRSAVIDHRYNKKIHSVKFWLEIGEKFGACEIFGVVRSPRRPLPSFEFVAIRGDS